MALVTWSREVYSSNRMVYLRQTGVKQVPFVKGSKPMLTYVRHHQRRITADLGHYGPGANQSFWGELIPSHIAFEPAMNTSQLSFSASGDPIYAKAYDRFKDKAYVQAANLTALAEARSTFSMVGKRLHLLVKAATALKRGRLQEFFKVLGILVPKKKDQGRKYVRTKQFSSYWLEYWMGWAPVIGDIYNTIGAIQQPIPDQPIRASASGPLSDSKVTHHNGGVFKSSYSGKGQVFITGRVEVSNPNLHLAQKLGLINPALTAWEVTPFSWLTGWFHNLSQTLGQVTDWVGLRIKDLCVSVKTKVTSTYDTVNGGAIYGWSQPWPVHHTTEWLWFTRHVPSTLPLIRPRCSVLDSLSITRGATLASLLATLFLPDKKSRG